MTATRANGTDLPGTWSDGAPPVSTRLRRCGRSCSALAVWGSGVRVPSAPPRLAWTSVQAVSFSGAARPHLTATPALTRTHALLMSTRTRDLLSKDRNERLRFRGSIGVPYSVQNTRPLAAQCTSARTLSPYAVEAGMASITKGSSAEAHRCGVQSREMVISRLQFSPPSRLADHDGAGRINPDS